MNLIFDNTIIGNYKSGSQIARVLTENWVSNNIYCPACGNTQLKNFNNNNPVGDFFCDSCTAEYELKSKKDAFTQKIVDGAYATMIRRINSNNNPHFFFLNYSAVNMTVQNFLVIPKYYFVDHIIEKRTPLAETARRAGWTGCNILLKSIPSSGRIFFIRDGKILLNNTY
jgi:type II restriction enzyme